jgi:hypothetical protein
LDVALLQDFTVGAAAEASGHGAAAQASNSHNDAHDILGIHDERWCMTVWSGIPTHSLPAALKSRAV